MPDSSPETTPPVRMKQAEPDACEQVARGLYAARPEWWFEPRWADTTERVKQRWRELADKAITAFVDTEVDLPFISPSDPELRQHYCVGFPFRTMCCECGVNEVVVRPYHNASDTNCTACQEDALD